MRSFTIIMILAALAQASFLPTDLVLLLLISRTIVTNDEGNLYLAFIGGVLLGVLLSINIGFYSLIFIIFVQALRMMRKHISSSNFLLVVPITLVALLITALLEKIFLKQSINTGLIFVETILSLPTYLLVRFWEERFVVAPPLKLKV